MFENVIKAIGSLNSSLYENKVVLLEGNTNTDANTILPYFFKYYMNDVEETSTNQNAKKIILFSFDETLGVFHNLCRHLGVNLENEHKNKRFEGVALGEFLTGYIDYDLPFIMNPGSLWKTFGNFAESFSKFKGDLKKILLEIITFLEQNDDQVVFFSGLNNLFNIVDDQDFGIVFGFFDELFAQKKNNGFVLSLNMGGFFPNEERLVNFIKEECDLKLSQVLNQGGYSKDITGQIKISQKYGPQTSLIDEIGVKSKTLKYSVKDNAVDFFETYTIK